MFDEGSVTTVDRNVPLGPIGVQTSTPALAAAQNQQPTARVKREGQRAIRIRGEVESSHLTSSASEAVEAVLIINTLFDRVDPE